MGNIVIAELCEEKIYYPGELSKQEEETGGVKCVWDFFYCPPRPHIVWLLQRLLTEIYIHKFSHT